MNFQDTPQGRKFLNQDFPKLILKLGEIADEIRELRLALKPEPAEDPLVDKYSEYESLKDG